MLRSHASALAWQLAEAETDYWLTEHVARLGRSDAVERVASLLQEAYTTGYRASVLPTQQACLGRFSSISTGDLLGA